MSDFLLYVFDYLRRAMVLVLPAMTLCALCLGAVARSYRKKHEPDRKFPWGKVILWMLLGAWLTVVLFVTVVRAGHTAWRHANWNLFRAWREAWNDFSEKSWLYVLLNIVMFVPLGMLLPCAEKRFRRWHWMLFAGFDVTLAVETAQYLMARGLFDVDDLFCNTLGTMMGFWLVMAGTNFRRREFKHAVGHAMALAMAVLGICGIFAGYALKEFGNLPEAPAFRTDTSDISWTLAFTPEIQESTVPIYRLNRPSREECAAFGEEFLKKAGVAETDLTYYNDVAYLRERHGNRIVEVFYLDGTYEYYDLESMLSDAEHQNLGETAIRDLLQAYGIMVPEQAEHSMEEDEHSFRANRLLVGNTMTDGMLSCRYGPDRTLVEIRNHIKTFSWYADVAVISQQEAVDQVMDGWLSNGDYLEYEKPKSLAIRSCVLSWRVDTKGFYQPVYELELVFPGNDHVDTVLISAMK